MIGQQQITSIVDRYDAKNVTVGVIGSHSALEVMDGAKDEGLRTVCICQKGSCSKTWRARCISSR